MERYFSRLAWRAHIVEVARRVRIATRSISASLEQLFLGRAFEKSPAQLVEHF